MVLTVCEDFATEGTGPEVWCPGLGHGRRPWSRQAADGGGLGPYGFGFGFGWGGGFGWGCGLGGVRGSNAGADQVRRCILNAMTMPRCDVQSFAGSQPNLLVVDFYDCFAEEHEEELLGMLVIVTNLCSTSRHLLLDNGELRIFQ